MNWRNFRFGGSCIIAIIFIGIVPFAYLLLGMSNFHFISSVWDSKVFPGVQVDLGKYALFLQPPGLCSPPPPMDCRVSIILGMAIGEQMG